VLDDGAVTTEDLAGQLSPLSRDFGSVTENGQTRSRGVIGDANSDHGTLVAAVLAASNDGRGVQGVAPGASIAVLRASDDDLDTGEETFGNSLLDAIDYAARQGIKVLNVSLAREEPDVASHSWQRAVERYTASGGLYVNAAGNEGGANPQNYLDLDPSNSAGWIFVVAMQPTGTTYELADYSNRCGTAAMSRCVAAMGTAVTRDIEGDLVYFTGTSAAAPQVSGLAALILSKWPQLSGVQAGEVILNTARDVGAAGTDPVFGRGLIDVRAALSPVDPMLSNGAVQMAVEGSTMTLPGVLGDPRTTGSIKAMLSDVTVLDAYGRDYAGDLSTLVASSQERGGRLYGQLEARATLRQTVLSSDRLDAAMAFTSARYGPREEDVGTRLGYGEFTWKAGTGTRLTAAFNAGDGVADMAAGLAPTSDVVAAYLPGSVHTFGAQQRLAGGWGGVSVLAGGDGVSARGLLAAWSGAPGRIKLGLLDERGTVFGSATGSGALRFGDGARTVFAEVSRSVRWRDWTLDGYASIGSTRLELSGDTLLTGASPFVTERFGVSAGRRLWGGTLRFGLAQPLTVTAGRAQFTLATAYDLESRALIYAQRAVDLGGRAFDPLLTFGFERPGPRSSFSMGFASRSDGTDARALASWRLTLP